MTKINRKFQKPRQTPYVKAELISITKLSLLPGYVPSNSFSDQPIKLIFLPSPKIARRNLLLAGIRIGVARLIDWFRKNLPVYLNLKSKSVVVTVNNEGKIIDLVKDKKVLFYSERISANVSLEMISIPGRKFFMGRNMQKLKNWVINIM